MKIIVLLTICLLSSCAYKPRLLVNTSGVSKTNVCMANGLGVNKTQYIYKNINSFKPKLDGTKELRYIYNLNDFLPLSSRKCYDKNYLLIQSIETSILFFSDTSVIKNGIHLKVNIAFIADNNTILVQDFEITKENEFYSGWTATKKKVNKKIIALLNEVFIELIKQVSVVQ